MKKFSKVAALAAAAAMAVNGSQVLAQTTDSDSSGLTIDIGTTITVTACQANVYLGAWPAPALGSTTTVTFGATTALASCFDIAGTMLDWDVSAAYADLVGPGNDIVVQQDTAGNDLCVSFASAGNGACDQVGEAGVGIVIDDVDHVGAAEVWVGGEVIIDSSVVVQANGNYTNATAITLTGDLLLGTNG